VWLAVVARSTKKGYAAYARQNADMYQRVANDARDRLTAEGVGVSVAEHTRYRRPTVDIKWGVGVHILPEAYG
jgi:hypothetical protein